jgi:hypothetical protein
MAYYYSYDRIKPVDRMISERLLLYLKFMLHEIRNITDYNHIISVIK